MDLCGRHEDALVTALELRGLMKPPDIRALLTGNRAPFDPAAFARLAITDHAMHFAGKAAAALLSGKDGRGKPWCPICFVNRAIREGGKNPGLTVDDWVNNAADEALDADVAHQDTAPVVHGVRGATQHRRR